MTIIAAKKVKKYLTFFCMFFCQQQQVNMAKTYLEVPVQDTSVLSKVNRYSPKSCYPPPDQRIFRQTPVLNNNKKMYFNVFPFPEKNLFKMRLLHTSSLESWTKSHLASVAHIPLFMFLIRLRRSAVTVCRLSMNVRTRLTLASLENFLGDLKCRCSNQQSGPWFTMWHLILINLE